MEIQLHEFQFKILKKLAGTNSARFNELLIEGLESEHMNYHLKRLVDFGLVEKGEDSYFLTDRGKNFSNLLNDEVNKVEKQPKTSILLHAVRKNENSGEIEYLVNKRLRQPYYGKIGRLTGKIRFGETPRQAAERELYEETGLNAKVFVLEKIYHKMRYREDGTFVQDTFFFTFFVTNFYGKFIEKTEFQENLWITKKDLKNKDMDFFEGLKLANILAPKKFSYVEEAGVAVGY